MVSINIENKPGFNIIGTKTWIPGTGDNDVFAKFWKQCHADGTVDQIGRFRTKKESVTKSAFIGLSCTEKDPNVRSFYFYVAVETQESENQENLEVLTVIPYRWAIFASEGNDIRALMECEMYAWKEWLPNNGTYIHDNGPEMEVYFQEQKIEYWIPIKEK